jgi:glutamine amidotransferase
LLTNLEHRNEIQASAVPADTLSTILLRVDLWAPLSFKRFMSLDEAQPQHVSRIAIPRLPCGNFLSVRRMIEKAGGVADVVDDPSELLRYGKVILAGVGSFDHGMRGIHDGNWLKPLTELALQRRVPMLGICLGMQMLAEGSEEGQSAGLGWLRGRVRKLRFPHDSALRVPHMGWNLLKIRKQNELVNEIDPQRFYFVHSYHFECSDPADVLATTHYGGEITAAVSRDNIMGVQFHPEKSHRFGLALMRRFVELPC